MKGIEKLKEGYPLLNKLIATEEVFLGESEHGEL